MCRLFLLHPLKKADGIAIDAAISAVSMILKIILPLSLPLPLPLPSSSLIRIIFFGNLSLYHRTDLKSMPPARQTSTEKTSALKMSQSAAVKNTCIASACAENACFSIHMLIITIIFTQVCKCKYANANAYKNSGAPLLRSMPEFFLLFILYTSLP